ncbi:hypothetical protein HJC23_010814 [Cyclotella cryptica]|uniref:D-isomer specific 2-hydroxyacid dehydrogenase NAD-binding domain-containing protein n=1 Tax=Cyclotella cryptica TaxID=29204 RepID=A0ABD3QP00_9STRA
MLVTPFIATAFVRSISTARHSSSKASTFARHLPSLSPSPSLPAPASRKFHHCAFTQRADMYWNRETSMPSASYEGEIIREARIIALSDPNDAYNLPLYNGPLPEGSKLLAVGSSVEDFDKDEIIDQKPNVMFVSHPNSRGPLVELLQKFPSLEWVHTRSAGIDFIASEGLAKSNVALTNAKGMFSSTLAEYCMMACSYFAKDLPRLMKQKNNLEWEQYPVLELRGSTLGVVGYGDIGRASAKLAKAYGMRVVGLKRNAASFSDPYCDHLYGIDGLNSLMAESDYILISTPLTEQTRGMISADVLSHCKQSAVIINVGRGPIIDENALIEALKERRIKGAGLDVMTIEPLPKTSPLWTLDNVLLSPHNMDMTLTFMRESTEFFINENLPRYLRGKQLLNPVDKAAGY